MSKYISLILKLIISAVLLYFAFCKIDLAGVANRLIEADMRWLSAAFALLIVQLILSSYRWRMIAELCGIVVSISRVFRLIWIGAFFNQTLPSSVGGDAMRIWLLVRDGASWPAATYSVLLDRIFGVFALAILVAGTTHWAFSLIADPIARTMLAAIGFTAIAAFIAFTLLRHAEHSLFMRWRFTRHFIQLSKLAGDTVLSPRSGPAALILSLCIQFGVVLTLWCIGRAAHTPFDLLQALVIVPPVMLISTLPISIAGWGVRESALALAFSYAGLSQADGIFLSLLFGAAMLILGIVGGVIWLTTSHPTPVGAATSSAQ